MFLNTSGFEQWRRRRRRRLMSFTFEPRDKASRNARYSKQRRKCLSTGARDVCFQVRFGNGWKVTQSISLSPSFLPPAPGESALERPLVLVSAGVFGLPVLIGWPVPESLRSRQTKPGRGGMFRRRCGHPTTASGRAKIADPSPFLTALF